MLRRFFLTVAGAAAFVPWTGGRASANETVLNARQIKELLSGNTIAGKWDGTPYRSYYDPTGLTVYQPDGGSVTKGKWQINPETGEYESWWQHTGWISYTILRTDTGYAWRQGVATQPFAVIEGRQIDF